MIWVYIVLLRGYIYYAGVEHYQRLDISMFIPKALKV